MQLSKLSCPVVASEQRHYKSDGSDRPGQLVFNVCCIAVSPRGVIFADI